MVKRDILFYKDDLTWSYLALLCVVLVYLRDLYTYLLHPLLARTGHPTPRPTPWALCICRIQF
jgi:hypothetical protein